MHCQEFREIIDSYLSSQLLIETNHEVLRHLENCASCRNELAARRELLAQMRSAVKNAPEMRLNPVFARQLRDSLREVALRPTIWEKSKRGFFVNSPLLAATIAACLLVGILFGATWMRRQYSAPENTVALQNRTVEPAENLTHPASGATRIIQTAWRETMRTAIGDHNNCALHFRLKEDPITLDEAAEKYGRFNKNLDTAVKVSLREISTAEKASGKTVGKIEFLEAHSCIFNGRRFAHIVLRKKKKIISILVTDADLSTQSDDAITNQADENLQVARFVAARYAVFVVSDLSEQENLKIAEILSPALRRHIEQTEA